MSGRLLTEKILSFRKKRLRKHADGSTTWKNKTGALGNMENEQPYATLYMCDTKETVEKMLIERLQPYQKDVVNALKNRSIHSTKNEVSSSPWRNIGELGEIAYMEDGTRRWLLKDGHEKMRLFAIYLTNGKIQKHYAYIDDSGALCNYDGDNIGWVWCDADLFMDIPELPRVEAGSDINELAENWARNGFPDVAIHFLSKTNNDNT